MAALQYRHLLDYLTETVLRPRLNGAADKTLYPDVDVNQMLDQPTSDMTPAVRVVLGDVSFEPFTIAAMNPQAAPDWSNMTVHLFCVAFSAESSADASRQRDDLIERVENALREDPTFGCQVGYCFRRSIKMLNQPDESGLFAVGVMELEIRKFV